jgi:ABC-type phosphate transport system substrate-binding protein
MTIKNTLKLGMKLFSTILIAAVALLAIEASAQSSGFVIIGHPSQKDGISKKEIYDLYVGNMRMREVEVVEQADGKQTRSEFYKRFLKKSPAEMKQHWSVLVFSGNRAPKVLNDDNAVLEYVKNNTNALGYVSTEYWERVKSQFKGGEAPIAIYAGE